VRIAKTISAYAEIVFFGSYYFTKVLFHFMIYSFFLS
jgi:hypothetical protein